MRKLARDVGVSAPALYRHFENREKVLIDVVGEAHDEMFRALSRALSGATPLERFEMAAEAYMDFALKHPRYFQMIHSFMQVMGMDEAPPELAHRACAIQQFWEDRVRECIDTDILRPDNTERIGLTLWAHAYGLLSLYSRGLLVIPEEDFREEFRTSHRRILFGLGKEAAGRIFGRTIHVGAEHDQAAETRQTMEPIR
jgi:AcrR family transcriptional regulator